MRRFWKYMAMTELDIKNNNGAYQEIDVFEHGGESYVKLDDFSHVVALNAKLALDMHENALKEYADGKYLELEKRYDNLCERMSLYMQDTYEAKKQSRKRGKLIARLQKKLHNCYFTIFELQKLCAILLQNDGNFNLCMVKTGLPTYFLMKMRNWKGLKDE